MIIKRIGYFQLTYLKIQIKNYSYENNYFNYEKLLLSKLLL